MKNPKLEHKMEDYITYLVKKFKPLCFNEKPVILHSIRVANGLYELGYEDKIVLTEISVQDGKDFTNQQIKKYNITLVPTMIFLDSNNKQVRRVEGAIEKDVLENYLKELK